MNLAPVGICTYTRLDHLMKTIEALKANTLAQQTELYIFSDGPRPGDEAKVQELRDYLTTITGFKKVHPRLQPTNNMFENTTNANMRLNENYGRSIFIEDDIVTSPYFLEFMNESLEKYESNKKVMSIGGYCPPVTIPKNYASDVFFSQIFCPWGLGMWKDRFELVNQAKTAWSRRVDPDVVNSLKYLGKDFVRRYKALCKESVTDFELAAKFDLLATVTMLKHQMFSVQPRQTMIENIGFDGTGLHCHSSDDKFFHKANAQFRPKNFTDDVSPDQRVARDMYMIWSFSKKHNPVMKSFYLLIRYLNYRLNR